MNAYKSNKKKFERIAFLQKTNLRQDVVQLHKNSVSS
jgi:hypothetical protein